MCNNCISQEEGILNLLVLQRRWSHIILGATAHLYILITLFIISSTTIDNVCAKPKHYFHFRNPSADDTRTALCAFKALFAKSNHWMIRFRVFKLLKGKTVIFLDCKCVDKQAVTKNSEAPAVSACSVDVTKTGL